ncbi:MAG: VOC family protein [Planctomycetia bacterium]|nr:VOC family protein [Planctomycetia bacterium]
MSTAALELHHTAYRVPTIEKSISDWCRRFGARVELGPTAVAADRVVVAFLSFPGGRIELIESQDSNTPSPTQMRRPDHVCFICSDFDDRVARAAAENAFVVRTPAPSEAFGMRRMCFVLYNDIGLVELVEARAQSVTRSIFEPTLKLSNREAEVGRE